MQQRTAALWLMPVVAFLAILAAGCTGSTGETQVQVLRVPSNGIQPMVQKDGHGIMHMIYFTGEPSAGNVFYRKREPGQSSFSEPIRVNSQPESVIAKGTVRRAQMSVTESGHVHVAWMGSSQATPRGPDGAAPMLYTRLTASGDTFEMQRNVMQHAVGLDGGGAVAASNDGNVYVVWHANPEQSGEEERRVWMAQSIDEGDTFQREVAISDSNTGACGCCGISAAIDPAGKPAILYRAATNLIGRDMYLLTPSVQGRSFNEQMLESWEINACPMSTSSAFSDYNKLSIAWETDGQVTFGSTMATGEQMDSLIKAPGDNRSRKHPEVAHNTRGETILVWTEGMGWERGGTLHWQVFDKQFQASSLKGQAGGVPVWSRPAVTTDEQGNFLIFY